MGLGWQAGTQNLPLPNRLRAGRLTNPEGPKVLRTPAETPMEDPFGKSQERPRVFPAFAGRAKASAGRRKSSVVLPNVGGTKDLREGFTFELLLYGTPRGVRLLPGGSIWVFSPTTRSPERHLVAGFYKIIPGCCKDKNGINI